MPQNPQHCIGSGGSLSSYDMHLYYAHCFLDLWATTNLYLVGRAI